MRGHPAQKQTLGKSDGKLICLNLNYVFHGVSLLFCITYHCTSHDAIKGKLRRTITIAHSSFNILGKPYYGLKRSISGIAPWGKFVDYFM